MPEWKQWHILGSGEFPKLEKLSIANCPKLMGKLPENLSSLTELNISRTPLFDEAALLASQLQGMQADRIVKLSVVHCNSLTSLPFSILPSTLKTIRISRCQKLKLEQPVCEMSYSNMFLEDLTLQECDLLPRARILRVQHSPNLTSFLVPTATESLHNWNCENLEITSVACLGKQMKYLCIFNCSKLKWLPERMQQLLPSLKTLNLWNCPEIVSFPEGELHFNLQVLEICNCTKLVNGRKVWRLLCLRELVITHDGSDEEIEHWELPYSIQ